MSKALSVGQCEVMRKSAPFDSAGASKIKEYYSGDGTIVSCINPIGLLEKMKLLFALLLLTNVSAGFIEAETDPFDYPAALVPPSQIWIEGFGEYLSRSCSFGCEVGLLIRFFCLNSNKASRSEHPEV
jgi:hypothetical protein